MNRKLGIFLLAILLVGLAACSSGGGTNPNQAEVNATTENLSRTAQSIFDDFDVAASCAGFQTIIDSFDGSPVACDSGTVTFDVVDGTVNCTDGNPFTAEATFSIVADNCQDNDFNTLSDGSLQLDADFEGNGAGDVNVSSTGIIVNGLSFDFDNFLLTITATGNITCTGNMSVDGDSCDVAADCNSCAF